MPNVSMSTTQDEFEDSCELLTNERVLRCAMARMCAECNRDITALLVVHQRSSVANVIPLLFGHGCE